MDELIAFLRARYGERDDAAQDTARGYPPPWSVEDSSVRDANGHVVMLDEFHGCGALEHIALHDPGATLRDIAAKRAIVERCEQAISDQGLAMEDGQEALAECILVQLGTEFSGHPEYKQEWELWW
jgi:hypothetical protein